MNRPSRRSPRLLLAVLAAALVVTACGAPILANAPAPRPTAPPEPTLAPRPADPVPVVVPRDDGPHDRLTEWWYYTGHLVDETGGRWGFEYVIFRAERGGFPVSWASHLALTDETGGRFHYAQRAEIGPQADRSPRDAAGAPQGFAFALSGIDPTNPATFGRSPWLMGGALGRDLLRADAGPDEVAGDPSGGIGLDLALDGSRFPVVLHDRDGWIDFGPAGGSYYYSRVTMDAAGTLRVGDRVLRVTGSAWFDHQWGDFIAVGAGGWDWFAVNLADGSAFTVSLVRAADGTYPLIYGTYVEPDGSFRHLERDDLAVEATRSWTSPATGATWPAGWTIRIPGEGLVVDLVPTVPQQELDTRPTTGVVYWEGSQRVTATRDGVPLGGEAYVELTGYAGDR